MCLAFNGHVIRDIAVSSTSNQILHKALCFLGNQAVDRALKHIKRDELASTREVEVEQHDKLFRAVDNKIKNLFNVVNLVLLCFILFYYV